MPTGVYEHKKNGIFKLCPICNNNFYVFPYQKTKKKFCSKKCFDIFQRRFRNWKRIKIDKLTPELSYILGVVLGDGWIRFSNGCYLIGLEVKDKDFAEEFARNIEKWSGRGLNIRFNREMWHVNFCSIIHTAKIKKLLSTPLKFPNIYCRQMFFKGIFDSEGTITKEAGFSFGVYNKDFKLISLVRNIGHQIGFTNGKFYRCGTNNEIYKLLFSGSDNLSHLLRIGITIERKRVIALKKLGLTEGVYVV